MNNLRNIKFEYEYRDAAGYRNGGSVVFVCAQNDLDLEKITDEIRKALFDREFFYPYKIKIPRIHFDQWNAKLDHDWYRFENIDFTDEQPSDERTFEEFLQNLKLLAKEPVL